jgi:hypothetical protein
MRGEWSQGGSSEERAGGHGAAWRQALPEGGGGWEDRGARQEAAAQEAGPTGMSGRARRARGSEEGRGSAQAASAGAYQWRHGGVAA